MGTKLTEEVLGLLADKNTSKVLATLDEKGFPHAVGGLSLEADENGNLLYLEHFESSITNKNLTRSFWYDTNVSIVLSNSQGQSVQIKGKPVKVHITGPLFLKYYQELRQTHDDLDLSGVWVIEPQEIINEGQAVLKASEETGRKFFIHLDRLAK